MGYIRKNLMKGEMMAGKLKKTVVFCVLIGLMFGITLRVKADIIRVNEDGSGDYLDIPNAVFDANDGDTIIVGPGEYTGAYLDNSATGLKIIGSGLSTRIVRPCYEESGIKYGFYVAVPDVVISNLSIELENVQSTDFVFGILMETQTDLDMSAANGVVENVVVKSANKGIAVRNTENPRIEGNIVVGDTDDRGIFCTNCANPIITNNYIAGNYWACVDVTSSTEVAIHDNNIAGSYSLGIFLYISSGAICSNVVSGTGDCGIGMFRVSDCNVTSNMIKNFHCLATEYWGVPIHLEKSQKCIINNNAFVNVFQDQNDVNGNVPISGILGYGTLDVPCLNITVQNNDFSKSGLPGWNQDGSGGPGCISLNEYFTDGLVVIGDDSNLPGDDPNSFPISKWVQDLGINNMILWEIDDDVE
jgi:parallel beta-helix repeat protein